MAFTREMFTVAFIITCLAAYASSQALSCNFDSASKNSTVLPCTCDGSPCSLNQVTATDQFDWLAWQGSTPSGNTGPSDDHTLQNGNGLFIYFEASKQNPGDRAMIRTNTLSLGQTSCLTFWYHMFGQHIGSLEVMATFNNGTTATLWELSGSQGNFWAEAAVPLHSSVNLISIVATRGGLDFGMPYGDIGMDDTLIERQLCPGQTNPPGATTTTTSRPTTAAATTITTSTQSPITSTVTHTTSMSYTTSTQAGITSTAVSATSTMSPTDTTSSSSTTPSTAGGFVTTESVEGISTYSSTELSATSSAELPTVSSTSTSSTAAEPADRGSNATLWGLDETLWIIILVVAGAVILVLLVIVCVQACAMRRMRSARIVRQSDDYSNIEAYNRDPYTRDPKGNNFINAYDNMAVEPENKPAAHSNGGGLI